MKFNVIVINKEWLRDRCLELAELVDLLKKEKMKKLDKAAEILNYLWMVKEVFLGCPDVDKNEALRSAWVYNHLFICAVIFGKYPLDALRWFDEVWREMEELKIVGSR